MFNLSQQNTIIRDNITYNQIVKKKTTLLMEPLYNICLCYEEDKNKTTVHAWRSQQLEHFFKKDMYQIDITAMY